MAWALPESAVLGILGRRPDPERVEGPLADALGREHAASVEAAMLFDTVDLWGSDRVLEPGGRRVLVFDPPQAGPWFDSRVPDSFALVPRGEGDRGAMVLDFLASEIADGARRVVLIGADAPTLDPTIVISAFLTLEGRDVVLGPATHGSYYLVGCHAEAPPIFHGVDWSSSEVLARTVDHLNATGHSLAILPPWYVVATPADLRVLHGHIRAMRRAGMNPGLPRTEAVLEHLFPRS